MGKAGTTSKAGTANNESFLLWEQISPHDARLKERALEELIEAWKYSKDNTSEGVTWGDEVEYQMIHLDDDQKEAYLSLRQDLVLDKAENRGAVYEWQPEYTKYMAESSPRGPFSSTLADLARVHTSMVKRRKELQSLIGHDAHPFTLTLFPLLGSTQNQYSGDTKGLENSTYNSSRYTPDEVISTRTRYRTLEANARARKGKSMMMRVPLYRDERAQTADRGSEDTKHIDLEGTIFGAGACGLQVTMEADDIHEACELHDQLCALGPIMLALTASTPIFKGYLADIDARWTAISQCIDDRTQEEMETVRPRWAPCPMYLGDSTNAKLAEPTCTAEESIRSKLEKAGMTDKLAWYYASHFTRSIFLVSQEDLEGQADPNGPSLWVRLSGTVFPHVRVKMPETKTDGWRVEFRPMEVQFTDFQNAALAVFVMLFRQLVRKHNLDFRISIRDIHQDIENAHVRDSCRKGRFWWRRLRTSETDTEMLVTDHEPALLSLDQIFNGDPSDLNVINSLGLVPALRNHVNNAAATEKASEVDTQKIHTYLDFIQERASGANPTGACFIRDIVMKHKDYRNDSKISPAICYDIVSSVKQLMDHDLASIP